MNYSRTNGSGGLQPVRIVVIGGNPELLRVLGTALSRCRPNEIAGRIPLRPDMYHRVNSLAPDLVIIDGSTPGGDEFEATQRAKIHREPPAVIVLSPEQNEEYQESMLSMGADACVAISRLETDLPPLLEKLFPLPSANGTESSPEIFVVDDDAELADLAAINLRSLGFEVHAYHDPMKALAAVREGEARPDILITDFQMPHLNGLELIRKCRSVLPSIRTISASGNLRHEHIQHYGVQPDRVVAKPYHLRDLLKAITELWPSVADRIVDKL